MGDRALSRAARARAQAEAEIVERENADATAAEAAVDKRSTIQASYGPEGLVTHGDPDAGRAPLGDAMAVTVYSEKATSGKITGMTTTAVSAAGTPFAKNAGFTKPLAERLDDDEM